MTNPVLAVDLLLASRRSRPLTARCFYALWLLLQFACLGCIWIEWPVTPPASWDMTEVVELFLEAFIVQHFLLLLVAVPAYLAGAITDEKAKGTLLLLLTADVSPWQIVVGKLFARLLQVLTLVSVGLPLFCLVGAYFGVLTSDTILGLVLLTLAVLFALGGLSVWVSVRSTQARDAALRLYVLLGLVVVGAWALVGYAMPRLTRQFRGNAEVIEVLGRIKQVILGFEPLHILGPSTHGDDLWSRLFLACSVYFGIGLVFLILAAWQLRSQAIRYLEQGRSERRKCARRHPVVDDPVSWRERLAGRKLIHWVGAFLLMIATTEACRWILPKGIIWYLAGLWSAAGVVLSLPLSIRASGAITGERDRQTWDTLLMTPLETWEIVVAKRWGVLQAFGLYFLAFLVPVLILSCVLGFRAVLLSLAMLLIWGMALFLFTSTGIWCSAFARSSWRSLVATVARGYGFFLGILTIIGLVYLAAACVLSPVMGILSNFMGVTSVPEDALLGVIMVTSLYLAWRLHKAANTRLWLAQTWIDTRERYGRTFTRSLTRALKNARERQEMRKKTAELAAVSRRRVTAEDPPRYSS